MNVQEALEKGIITQDELKHIDIDANLATIRVMRRGKKENLIDIMFSEELPVISEWNTTSLLINKCMKIYCPYCSISAKKEVMMNSQNSMSGNKTSAWFTCDNGHKLELSLDSVGAISFHPKL